MQDPKPSDAPLTYAEFLAYAEAHEGRFEYVDGRAVPLHGMGQPSDAHQDLAFELGARISARLEGSGCKVRLAGRLMTAAGTIERVPDLMVICDGKPRKLICEILSANRGDDLGKKLSEYRAMPEFDEYLVIDSTSRWVRLFRRTADGGFNFDVDRIAGSVHLHSIDYTVDIDRLYDDADVAAV